jgi:transcriptional regulator with XRE-family HTH domain
MAFEAGIEIDPVALSLAAGAAAVVIEEVITSYERGVSTPPLNKLLKLAKIFGASLDELVGKAPAKTAAPAAEKLHQNKRAVKFQKLFDRLSATEQRALLKMVEVTVQKQGT